MPRSQAARRVTKSPSSTPDSKKSSSSQQPSLVKPKTLVEELAERKNQQPVPTEAGLTLPLFRVRNVVHDLGAPDIFTVDTPVTIGSNMPPRVQLTLEAPLATIDATGPRTMRMNAVAQSATTDATGTTFNNVFIQDTSITGGSTDWLLNRTYPITGTATFNTIDTTGAIRFDPNTGATMTYDTVDDWLTPTQPFTIRMGSNLDEWSLIQPDKNQIQRALMKQRLNPARNNHHGVPVRRLGSSQTFNNVRPQEIVALKLLRAMVPTDVFRRYLKDGFVTTRGPSGLVYQIKRNSHMIYVWDKGKKIASLCVYLKDSTIPPTDEIVAKMIIVECDEPDIWKRANVGWYVHGSNKDRYQERLAA